jgi:L-histidine Nalpha-methyltransferase
MSFMSSTVDVAIHSSQFPEQVRHDLLTSLRTRKINHKFHYDSIRQTQKWLALHQIYSPSRNDADCAATYDRAFAEAASRVKSKSVHVVGLGCGGGRKDARLLQLLKPRVRKIFYTPSDVSTAMVLVARETALKFLPEKNCFPFVCDLAEAEDLRGCIVTRHPSLVTFFGMIPNFEPDLILPRLAELVRPKDFLLFSANLSPGGDYSAGMKRILPQYDNAPTHEWLMTFLLDIGVERRDGELRFAIETGKFGLKRVVARFHFRRHCRIATEGNAFAFRSGDNIRLFFSCRYTPDLVRKHLARYGLQVSNQWITRSAEEGVFLCRRKTS